MLKVRVVLKVRKRGVLILPKPIRVALGVEEGDELLAEVVGGKLVMEPLRPKVVDLDPEVVERVLREERSAEEGRYSRLIRDAAGARHGGAR